MTDPSGAERFFDDYAVLYDAIYADHEFEDVAFYVERARACDGPVLDVACGTGRVYLELLREGVDADGFDVSTGMLEELRRKAEESGLEPSVWRADMTDFDAPREYALAIVPFRSFLHNLTVEDQLAALERIKAALEPDGELILNAFPPDFEEICGEFGDPTASLVEVDGTTYRTERLTEFADEVEQVVTYQWTFHPVEEPADAEATKVLDVDASRSVPELLVNEFHLSLISKQAFELLFRAAGFEAWSVYGGFELDPLESTNQEMVWIASP